jgi:hypothetical protein
MNEIADSKKEVLIDSELVGKKVPTKFFIDFL